MLRRCGRPLVFKSDTEIAGLLNISPKLANVRFYRARKNFCSCSGAADVPWSLKAVPCIPGIAGKRYAEDMGLDIPDPSSDILDQYITKENYEYLISCILELDEAYRVVFEYKYLHQMSDTDWGNEAQLLLHAGIQRFCQKFFLWVSLICFRSRSAGGRCRSRNCA